MIERNAKKSISRIAKEKIHSEALKRAKGWIKSAETWIASGDMMEAQRSLDTAIVEISYVKNILSFRVESK